MVFRFVIFDFRNTLQAMRIIILLFLVLMSPVAGVAQSKASPKFKLPAKISPSDYQAGKVWVKVRDKYKETFQQGGSAMRASRSFNSIKPLSVGKHKSTTARAQAFKPVIDISQYYEISFDPSIPVEEFITTLYSTGYVELAEPVYRSRMATTPNDPFINFQYHLAKIRAIEAWDITQGDEDIVIAIVDSGVDIDHPELVSQLYINTADPVNGIDDDHNGYIDDYRGWDFSGADTLNAFDPDFVGDNDPAIYKNGPGFGHGTQVGATASASTNDGVGIAGVGYKSKLMFIKHYADNQPAGDRSYSSNLYLGVLYAAENGAKVINCSWGSAFRSQVYQDIITHVTLDLGCLVVAAAGNDNASTQIYPASYEYALSVASTDQDDKRAGFSSYGSTVDLSAPGVSILTAQYDDGYITDSGTSLSAPIVSGAAALVWAVHPEYTPLQVGEQLRVTADESMYDQNAAFIHKLGKGRLDIYNALTQHSPSIRALNYELTNANGTEAVPGDAAFLYFDFINYLESSSPGLEISISTTSSGITITKDKITPGAINSGSTVRNVSTPFELTISNAIAENTTVDLLLTFSDGAYQDFQVFSFVPNPSYRNVDDNKIITTLSGSGKLAFEDTPNQKGGSGFIFNDESILFEMGLIMGSSPASILNTVRNGTGGYDADFVSIDPIKEIAPGLRSDGEIFGAFSNSTTVTNQKVVVSYRSLVWRDAPYDHFVILEYKIKNTQATQLNDFYVGLFADWDISFGGAKDAAQWDAVTKLGYVYPKQSTALPHAGIQLLSGHANYYAIDNDPSIGGNPLALYDGFTDSEKYASLSSGFLKTQAGNSTATGNDVSHVVSSGPYSIDPGEEITVSFALHAANNVTDLITSAKYADSVYNFTLTVPKPHVDTVEACYGSSGILTATGAGNFKWYRNLTGGVPVGVGTQFTIPELTHDTTLYVSNADHSYESIRTPAHIIVRAQATISASQSTMLCSGESVTLSVDGGNQYEWSNGETTPSIVVSEAGSYSVVIRYSEGALNCESTSEEITVAALPSPVADFTFMLVPENTLVFDDESTDAVEWFWNFGDGSTSEEQNPEHVYGTSGEYSIQLTVTGANGCQHSLTDVVAVVLSTENALERFVNVYPVPVRDNTLTVTLNDLVANRLTFTLIGPQGKFLQESKHENISGEFTAVMDLKSYRNGIYFLMVQADASVAVKKIIIAR